MLLSWSGPDNDAVALTSLLSITSDGVRSPSCNLPLLEYALRRRAQRGATCAHMHGAAAGGSREESWIRQIPYGMVLVDRFRGRELADMVLLEAPLPRSSDRVESVAADGGSSTARSGQRKRESTYDASHGRQRGRPIPPCVALDDTPVEGLEALSHVARANGSSDIYYQRRPLKVKAPAPVRGRATTAAAAATTIIQPVLPPLLLLEGCLEGAEHRMVRASYAGGERLNYTGTAGLERMRLAEWPDGSRQWFDGAAGSERMVRLVHADGTRQTFDGERGHERTVQLDMADGTKHMVVGSGKKRLTCILFPDGERRFYEGRPGSERVVCVASTDGERRYYSGPRGEPRLKRVEKADGAVLWYDGNRGCERLLRAKSPKGTLRVFAGAMGRERLACIERRDGTKTWFDAAADTAAGEERKRVACHPSSSAELEPARLPSEASYSMALASARRLAPSASTPLLMASGTPSSPGMLPRVDSSPSLQSAASPPPRGIALAHKSRMGRVLVQAIVRTPR